MEDNDLDIVKHITEHEVLSTPGINIPNIWTADQTFDAEVKGTKHSILLSHDAGAAIAANGTLFLKAGEVIMTITKGLTMKRAGSIFVISINYDITASGINLVLSLDVVKNGADVWTNILDDAVADDKESQFTQSRATDSFAAGDTISVKLFVSGKGAGTIDLNDIISMLEFYYDD